MVAAFSAASGQTIVEIGPGLGALTDALVAELLAKGIEQSTHITAVELDRELAHRLAKRYSPQLVRVIQDDVLAVKLRQFVDNTAEANTAKDNSAVGGRVRLIGNLPYNISTPLIFHLLAQLDHIQDMLFMLQKEVALRLAAEPGNKKYGRLSVMTAVALDCQLLFEVLPHAFNPPPQVNSMVLRLTPKKHPLQPNNPRIFQAVVAAAFCQRRKTLRNALAKLAQNQHFIHADIDSQLRAEALSVEQYIILADAIANEYPE